MTERLRVTDYLRGKMAEKRITNRVLSRKTGTSESYLSRQMHGHTWMCGNEYRAICVILSLDPAELRERFYLDFRDEGVLPKEYS